MPATSKPATKVPLQALLRRARALGDRPWGVGILGFVPAALREEQLAAITAVKPPAALIGGGRPSQARVLEEAGIPTFLHVPSPGLLDQFLRAGARRDCLSFGNFKKTLRKRNPAPRGAGLLKRGIGNMSDEPVERRSSQI